MTYTPREGIDAVRRDGLPARDVRCTGLGFSYVDPLFETNTGRRWVRGNGCWRFDDRPDDRDLVGDWVGYSEAPKRTGPNVLAIGYVPTRDERVQIVKKWQKLLKSGKA